MFNLDHNTVVEILLVLITTVLSALLAVMAWGLRKIFDQNGEMKIVKHEIEDICNHVTELKNRVLEIKDEIIKIIKKLHPNETGLL